MASKQEIVAPKRASRKLVTAPPIVYQEYPKTLEHPQGHDNHFPPVIVNDRNQELEYVSKGYEPPGKADPFGFLTSKATEKTDNAVRLMNERAAEATEKIREDVFASVREAIAENVADINDVLDALRDSNSTLKNRVDHLVEEISSKGDEVRALKDYLKNIAESLDRLPLDVQDMGRQKPKSWWQFWR